MPVFAYTVRDAAGQLLRGTIVAETDADGRQSLRDSGVWIERFSPALLRGRMPVLYLGSRAVRDEHIAEFARLLALMLRSGVPLSDAIGALIAQAPGGLRTVLQDVRERLESGGSFSDGLAEHPLIFGSMFTASVRVGEQAGTLETALRELADYLRERHSLTSKLTTAAVYPMILLTVATGVVMFLMTYVIPQLLTVLESNGQRLPWSTALLKGVSDVVAARWLIMIVVTIGLIVSVAALLRVPKVRRFWHGLLLRLPLVGVLLRKTLIARLTQQLSMMLASGIAFVDAVRIARQSTRNQILIEELESLERAVEAGGDIAPTLARSRVFPPLVSRLVAVGEDSGELVQVLRELREGYETEVRLAVTRFTAAIEPILIVFLATVVGFIVFATLMPILQATRGMA